MLIKRMNSEASFGRRAARKGRPRPGSPRSAQEVIQRDGSVRHRGEVVGHVKQVKGGWRGFIRGDAVTRVHDTQRSAAQALVRQARMAGMRKPRVSREVPGQFMLPFKRGRKASGDVFICPFCDKTLKTQKSFEKHYRACKKAEDDAWRREMAMEAGMGLGVGAYNDMMGGDSYSPDPCGHHCGADCPRCGEDW